MSKKLTLLGMLAIAAAMMLVGAGSGFAAILTWDGGSVVDNKWSTVANWVGEPAAGPVAGDTVVFDASSTARQTTGVLDYLIAGTGITIQIAADTPVDIAFTVGAALMLAAGTSINMTAAPVNLTIDNGAGSITLAGGGSTFNVVNLRTLTISEDINGNSLTVTGAGNTSISGVISNTGGLLKDDVGTLILSGTNTYTDNTTINMGTLETSAEDKIPNSSRVSMGISSPDYS